MDKIDYLDIKEKYPKAFEALKNFIDSEVGNWYNRALFDLFDSYEINVEINPSFDSKIRFGWQVSYMGHDFTKVIFQTGGLWIKRTSAENEAFRHTNNTKELKSIKPNYIDFTLFTTHTKNS